jgi:hypothetical protein
MDVGLHGDELDNAGSRREGDLGKGTVKKAEMEQIERETEAVGCAAAGMHLEHMEPLIICDGAVSMKSIFVMTS